MSPIQLIAIGYLYPSSSYYYYLRQVNEVNGGDNAFVRCVFVGVCVCVCVCLCVCSDRSWELNANSSKTVKATDFKFDIRVPRDSPDMTPTNFPKKCVFKNLFGGDMHSHERLLVIIIIIIIILLYILHTRACTQKPM